MIEARFGEHYNIGDQIGFVVNDTEEIAASHQGSQCNIFADKNDILFLL